jgi:hypothetical protein
MIPTTKEFNELSKHLSDILFQFVLAGRCRPNVQVTNVRYFIEVDREGWLINIYGLGDDSPMELDTISVYLMEKGYDVDNIEVFLESEL